MCTQCLLPAKRSALCLDTALSDWKPALFRSTQPFSCPFPHIATSPLPWSTIFLISHPKALTADLNFTPVFLPLGPY